MAVNGSNMVLAVVVITFGSRLMPSLANSMRLGAALAKR